MGPICQLGLGVRSVGSLSEMVGKWYGTVGCMGDALGKMHSKNEIGRVDRIEVRGKGKEILANEQVSLELLNLQTPKKKSPADQFIFQRRTATPTGSSGHDESSLLYVKLGLTDIEVESDEDVPRIDAGVQEEGQARPNPGKQDEGQAGPNPGEQDEGQAGPNRDDVAANIKMTMSKMKPNSKFVNNILPEWGRFVTAVKLNRGLRDSNYDQLYAYLKQHKAHANENKMMLDQFTQ
nr:integrase, catalytic region, zinc finger, CCHC-type, peptidase aspartic, catalytic [Tanacetum cinerariifolium]